VRARLSFAWAGELAGRPAGLRPKQGRSTAGRAAERQVAWEETPGSGECDPNRSRRAGDPLKPGSRSDEPPNPGSENPRIGCPCASWWTQRFPTPGLFQHLLCRAGLCL